MPFLTSVNIFLQLQTICFSFWMLFYFFSKFLQPTLKVGQTQKVLSARSLDFILRVYELLFQYILLLGEGNSIKNRENYFHKWNWSKVLVISVDHVFQPKSFLHGGHWFRRVYPWLKIALWRLTQALAIGFRMCRHQFVNFSR